MSFLETRDNNFDFVKSFLVISMIIAHSIQHLYSGYNRHLTYYVLIGFVFLSGLTVGAIYKDKFLISRKECAAKISARGIKLLSIYVLFNMAIMLLKPTSVVNSGDMLDIKDILFSAIMLDGGVRFSFGVLVSISFTFFISVICLSWKSRVADFLSACAFVLILWTIEHRGIADYYTVKMTIVGVLGVLAGKILSDMDWSKMKLYAPRYFILFLVAYLAYQSVIIIVDPTWDLMVRHHINITVLLLAAVYLISAKYNLVRYKHVRLLNDSLANNMLFAYLLHIIILRMFPGYLRGESMGFALMVGILLTVLIIAAGVIVNMLVAKYSYAKSTYGFIFK